MQVSRQSLGWFRPRAPFDASQAQAQQQARIDAKLRAIERQGTIGVRFGHALSYLLVFTFSVGALIALAGDALRTFLAASQRGSVDIPSLISFVVSFVLVFAMDTSMVLAATHVRMLRQRHQAGMAIHVVVIVVVCAVESATYLYMSYLYDHPGQQVAVWAILSVRALVAPAMAVYLSLARALPIGARDINTQVETVTGRGVLMDMTRIANDRDASTERKVALYRAAAVMDADDASRLDAIITAERATRVALPMAQRAMSVDAPNAPRDPSDSDDGPRHLGRHDARRAALSRDMLGAYNHPTSPLRPYDGDSDGDDDASALNWAGDELEIDLDAEDARRPQHVTRPRPRRASSSAASIQSQTKQRELTIDLPQGRTERPEDSPEGKRVMRYLDKHPNATIGDIMARARVTKATARRHSSAWRERNRRLGVSVAPITEEIPVVLPERVSIS